MNKVLKSIILAGALLWIAPLHAQKLTVIEQDYEQAKLECRKQNKLLLIDFYTTWCVPCKKLDGLVFKNDTVASQIAGNFVVLKYNAEKDSVHKLAQKHHINSYPVTILLNQQQNLLKRLYGFQGNNDAAIVNGYLDFLQGGITAARKNEIIKGVSASNKMEFPKFYADYVNRVNTKNVDSKVMDYWAQKPDYFSEVSFALLCYFYGGTEEVNQFFLKNRPKYEELYGEQDVRFVTSMLVSDKVYKAIGAKDRTAFAAALKMTRTYSKDKNLEDWISSMEVKMLVAEGNWKEAIQNMQVRKQAGKIEDWEIASFSWTAYQQCTDNDVLKQCADWMQAITIKTPEYATMDTYARLLFKQGQKAEAQAAMQKAIAQGKLNKETTLEGEDWLKKNF